MNAKKARALRQMARQELTEKPEYRDWVGAPKCSTTAINAPTSGRGFYRALKRALVLSERAHPQTRG